MKVAKWILPIIIFSQFCCTSLWFASNAIINDLISNFNLEVQALGNLTSAIQFGFITGTLVFALLTIADRFSPSKVFFVSALVAALFNISMLLNTNTLFSLVVLRFFTGFFLAGIYPIGMKIASDYYNKGLGKSLGFLVGALVLGTAFPHFLKGFVNIIPWKYVIIVTSILAVCGGLLLFAFVPNGPYRTPSQKLDFSALFKVFKKLTFRQAAFGYFGHMWELYAFWAFVPVMLSSYQKLHNIANLNIPLLSFLIIAVGSISCVIAGYVSTRLGTKKTATIILLLSALCCLISPLIFTITPVVFFISFLFFWGFVVIADSPLFSTLVAQNAITTLKGTALTIVNCVGFAITIVSIQLLSILNTYNPSIYNYTILAIGPILGLIVLFKRKTV
ncbi:MFS transporter [Pontimicrobium sp. MEBiC06410]